MNSRERVLTALARGIPDRVPFVDLGGPPGLIAKILGKDPADYGAAMEREFSETIGRDNISCWDTGAPVYYQYCTSSDGIQHYRDGLIKTRDDLLRVNLPDPNRDELYEKAAEFAQAKGDFAANAVMSMGADPVVLGMGVESFSTALYDDLGLVEELLDIYTDWFAVAYKRLCGLGFDFIWAADDIAYGSGPFFSPDVYREVFVPRLRKVADAITLPWIYHSDGNLLPLFDDLLSLGMNAVHPFEPGPMDIAQCKRDYGHRICVVGNVRVGTLDLGTPEEVEAEVKDLIENLGPGGGYMISTSNSFPAGTKVENVLAMGQAIRKYNSQPPRH